MHVMAAGYELVRHLAASEADPLGEDSLLMVLARGALALVNRVENAGTPRMTLRYAPTGWPPLPARAWSRS